MKTILTFFSLLVMISITAQAAPQPIPGLYPTGVDDHGTLLPVGSPEQHYVIVSGPVSEPKVQSKNTLWTAPPPGSAWIGVGVDAFDQDPPGSYRWRLLVDLAGFDHRTAEITGQWASDNRGRILLNGAFKTPQNNSLRSLTPFTINDGFIQGINHLDFLVTNIQPDGPWNPTGLVVKITGTAEVPEPATGLMLCTGCGWCVLRRRHKN